MKNQDYKTLRRELDDVLESLDSDVVDVDETVRLYEKGIKLVKELEDYLKNAENKINKVSTKLES